MGQRSTRTKEDRVISGGHSDWLTYYGMICEQGPLGHPLFDFLLVFRLINQPMCSSSQVWGHGFTNGFYWPPKMKRSLSIAKPRETFLFSLLSDSIKGSNGLDCCWLSSYSCLRTPPRVCYLCVRQMDSYNCCSALIQVRLVEKTKAIALRFSFSQDRGQKQRL